jgi:hypothetical protein
MFEEGIKGKLDRNVDVKHNNLVEWKEMGKNVNTR